MEEKYKKHNLTNQLLSGMAIKQALQYVIPNVSIVFAPYVPSCFSMARC